MRKTTISLILLSIILMVSCNGKHDARISTALSLADSDMADSALNILNKIDRDELPNSDDAMYCLVYTMVQDKSGLDVDNDSLIREAYDWYGKKPTDTLYAKCMYYMGKYYALNDSSEKALMCFNIAFKAAKTRDDYSTQCLALEQLSLILRDYDTKKAIAYAKLAVTIYNNVKDLKPSNLAYYLLNLAECMSYREINHDRCVSLAKRAIKYALQSKDSTTISNSYQDLSVFYSLKDSLKLAIESSKVSNDYNTKQDFSKEFALCQLYVLSDSFIQAKQRLDACRPLSYSDRCSLYYLKRTIALREHDWTEAEIFADSTDYFLEKKNSENLKAKNKYYELMLQKEIARTILPGESSWKTKLIYFISFTTLLIILLLSFIFYQRKKRMLEKEAEKEKLHQIEAVHKEEQLTTIKNFLLSKIDVVQRLMSTNSSDRKEIVLSNKDWREIEVFLNSVDDEFVTRLKKEFPKLTQKDIQFLMLVRLKLPYESIAVIYNIEEKSVKQRLFLFKSKLGLNKGGKSTREFIEAY